MVIIGIFFVFVFVFLIVVFFFVRLLSKEDTGSYRAIEKAGVRAFCAHDPMVRLVPRAANPGTLGEEGTRSKGSTAEKRTCHIQQWLETMANEDRSYKTTARHQAFPGWHFSLCRTIRACSPASQLLTNWSP